MNKVWRRLVWSLAALAVVAAAAVAWHFTRGQSGAPEYQVAQVTRGDIEESISALGHLQPSQFVDVGSQVTGQLKTLHLRLGDDVAMGDLLAEIDPALFQARVDEARASIRNLRAQVVDKQAQQHLATLQHARNEKLFAIDAASQESVQQSAAATAQTAAQVESLRAQIQQAQSRLDADSVSLRYAKLYAPMAGTIVSLTARQGQTLVASQTAPTILRIANLKTMTVWVQVSEADVSKIEIGMPVYFNTLGIPERRWSGQVRQLLPSPETVNNVVLYNVLFDVENADGALKTQMSAQAFFVLARSKNALLVPVAALLPISTIGKDTSTDVAPTEHAADGAANSASEKAPDEAAKKAVRKAAKKAEAELAQGGGGQADESSVDKATRKAAKKAAKLAAKLAEEDPSAPLQAGPAPQAGLTRNGKPQAKGKSQMFSVKVLKAGKVEVRPVRVGSRTRAAAEILSGLDEGDTVIVGVAETKDKARATRGLPRAGKL